MVVHELSLGLFDDELVESCCSYMYLMIPHQYGHLEQRVMTLGEVLAENGAVLSYQVLLVSVVLEVLVVRLMLGYEKKYLVPVVCREGSSKLHRNC